MRAFLLCPLALLTGCGSEAPADNQSAAEQSSAPGNSVGLGNAPDNGTVDNEPAFGPPQPAAAPTANAVAPVAGISAPPVATPVTDKQTNTEKPGPQAAARVVEQYHALISRGQAAQAWALWDDDGRASGMSRRAFAESFAKYATYRASVGAPGRVDAGAGQRHVTVPVRVAGTLKPDGAPFAIEGSMTLHRTGAIDGASAAQRRWRIASADLKPRPGEAAAIPATTARYRCIDGSRIVARFDNEVGTVTLRRGDERLGTLARQASASGIWYRGGGLELRGKGDDATITLPGLPPFACRAN